MHVMLVYDVTQILDLAHAKAAFLQVGTQFVQPKGLKDSLNVLQVFHQTFFEDQYVFQINNHEWVCEAPNYVIH